MSKTVILVGAGASIDAGIPSAFDLTRRVFDLLGRGIGGRPGGIASVLFGYVIAKLQGRRVLNGGSPFDPVNIEDAYEAVLQLLNRKQEFISEFVYSWDPILDSLRPAFDEKAFVRSIVASVADQSRSLSRGYISVDSKHISDAAKEIARATNPRGQTADPERTAAYYISILISVLAERNGIIDYIDELATFAFGHDIPIATLNYDVLLEEAAGRIGFEFDYGLAEWNDRKLVTWRGKSGRLMKLHGSVNWKGDYDHITVGEGTAKFGTLGYRPPLLIFGGQGRKLNPEGPFLQLRSEFEKTLMASERILIIGYSLGDEHLNALLRRWTSTRTRGKLALLNPGDLNTHKIVAGHSIEWGRTGTLWKGPVEIAHFKKGARDGLADALEFLTSRITRRPNGRRVGTQARTQ